MGRDIPCPPHRNVAVAKGRRRSCWDELRVEPMGAAVLVGRAQLWRMALPRLDEHSETGERERCERDEKGLRYAAD